MPALSVIAGPNGSGKSTLTSTLSFEGTENLIDPDAIARELDPIEPSRAAIEAARTAILRCRTFLGERRSFALETTLAGHGALATMREAKAAGYWVFFAYIGLGEIQHNLNRVRLRVKKGGHDVPEVDIARRYERSLRHAPEALRLADEAIVLDNSGIEPVRMLLLRGGEVVWRAEELPEWVRGLVEPAAP